MHNNGIKLDFGVDKSGICPSMCFGLQQINGPGLLGARIEDEEAGTSRTLYFIFPRREDAAKFASAEHLDDSFVPLELISANAIKNDLVMVARPSVESGISYSQWTMKYPSVGHAIAAAAARGWGIFFAPDGTEYGECIIRDWASGDGGAIASVSNLPYLEAVHAAMAAALEAFGGCAEVKPR